MGLMSFLGQGLAEGSQAPDFRLKDQNNNEQSLSQYKGQKIILYFYPADFTMGCTAEACSFRDEFEAFRTAKIPVIGISTDSVSKHAEFAEHHKIPFPILADDSKKVSKAYEVLLPIGKANRVTFLIDENQKIVKVLKWLSWKNYAQETQSALKNLGWF